MVNFKRNIKRRRGLSPLFGSVYLIIIGFLLISTLFITTSISGSALAENMKMEQERMQERILLVGPNGINLTSSLMVHGLRVNNTGSITVRIRALYIDQQFVCDPSQFIGDSYIEPKEAIWIPLLTNLVNIHFNETTINGIWTVTTERGSYASETGGYLLWGSPDDPISFPKAFWIGPFMIMFDVFHWRSGAGVWRSGWTIPKGTKDVTWRILVVNVDDRDIIIEDKSCFTLISNENSPKDPLPWYIDPTLTTMTFKPGVFNFVHYTWSKPMSEGGAKRQGVTGMQDLSTCINFLTFFGSYVEPDSTLTPIAQTIPFEAVLVTTESMADSVELTSEPQNILNDGSSVSTITAIVRDSSGGPVSDTWVDFYASTGTLSTSHDTTDSNGEIRLTLTSSLSQARSYVTAVCQGILGTTSVVFTPATGITVNADPVTIQKEDVSTITVQLIDGGGGYVAQSGISVNVEVSAWTGADKDEPVLSYEGDIGDVIIVTTDSNGRAILTLTSKEGVGTATIQASASGLNSGTTEVEVI